MNMLRPALSMLTVAFALSACATDVSPLSNPRHLRHQQYKGATMAPIATPQVAKSETPCPSTQAEK